ncbi:MAG: class I SAM-dependent methyltransferase [Rhodovarius sp.]|nr:class I SAM-dependent methyltransferase [Rhodovarius sp.]
MGQFEVEYAHELGAAGFVTNRQGDEPILVSLIGVTTQGERVRIGSCNAAIYRPDLVKDGRAKHPYCGFILPINNAVRKQGFRAFELVDGENFVFHRFNIQPSVYNSHGVWAGEVLELSDRSLFGVSGWALERGVLQISGALTPPDGNFDKIRLVAPPGVDARLHYPIHSPDAASYFWYLPGVPYFGFRIDVDLANSVIPDNSLLQFGLHVEGESDAYNELRNVTVPGRLSDFMNFPSDFHVKRVQRTSSAVAAPITGASDAERVAIIARRYLSRCEGLRVADWGCGFGRVARYVDQFLPGAQVTGIELDELNLNWLVEHLPRIRGIKVDLSAKVPLPDASFDLIYGISVMTHIRPTEQLIWLKELKRLLAPGGIMLLTTAGADAIAFTSRWAKPQDLEAWRRNGILVYEAATEYDSDIGGGGYYVQAKITPEKIRENWSEVVDVIDIIPAAFGYQEVVIAR